jgi:hypothetical protein
MSWWTATERRCRPEPTIGRPTEPPSVRVFQAADELILPLVHNSAGQFRTNVGFVQTSAGELTVHISAFSADGTLLGEGTFSSSSGFRQINNIFSELGIGSQVVEGGWLRVRLTGPAPSHWTCYASVIDSRTNDPTYVLPVEP